MKWEKFILVTLISLNLAELTSDELEKHVALAVRALDNTIDLTVTPLKESNKHNLMYRTIGVGAMGLADYLAREYMIYEESINEINELFERIALYSIKASALLAKIEGHTRLLKVLNGIKLYSLERKENGMKLILNLKMNGMKPFI